MRERERESDREHEQEREADGEAASPVSREPNAGLHAGIRGP